MKSKITKQLNDKIFSSKDQMIYFFRKEIQGLINKDIIDNLTKNVIKENSFNLIKLFKESVHKTYSGDDNALKRFSEKLNNISSKSYLKEFYQKYIKLIAEILSKEDFKKINNSTMTKFFTLLEMLDKNIISYDTYVSFTNMVNENSDIKDLDDALNYALNISSMEVINADYIYVDLENNLLEVIDFEILNKKENLVSIKEFIIKGKFKGKVVGNSKVIYEYSNKYLIEEDGKFCIKDKFPLNFDAELIEKEDPVILAESIIKNINEIVNYTVEDIKR